MYYMHLGCQTRSGEYEFAKSTSADCLTSDQILDPLAFLKRSVQFLPDLVYESLN